MRPISIMQGRLLPRYKNKYQAFPVGYWQAEFHIAKELGFSGIEWIVDYNGWDQNPLLNSVGTQEIKLLSNSTGVCVLSVCADCFMEASFHSHHQSDSEKILRKLIDQAGLLGIRDIVIPCVDQSSLKSESDKKQLIHSISTVLKSTQSSIKINLETDLNPRDFKQLLSQFDVPIYVNYDTGNSASLGYNPEEEFSVYGHLISDLHIKDRLLNGGSVPLGSGDVQFDVIFQLLKEYSFSGTMVMQTARSDNYLSDLSGVAKQLEFISKKWKLI